MTSPTVTLQSVTGVDVELRIAGAGSRSYAFVIDWHIRFIVAFAWFFIALFSYAGSLSLMSMGGMRSGWGYALVIVPPMIIYFLYHPILEIAMHGRTPGKRMAGVRLVSRTGDIPGAGALLVRNVFRIVDSLPFLYLVGLATVVFTEHQVRIGDLAAGTLLVHDEADVEKSFSGLHSAATASGLSAQSADLVHELLERWSTLDEASRSGIARQLLARLDPSISAEALAGMATAELHSRLREMLDSGPAA